jgi:hypothetical protein
LDLKRCVDELGQFGLSDQTEQRVLRLNAVEVWAAERASKSST